MCIIYLEVRCDEAPSDRNGGGGERASDTDVCKQLGNIRREAEWHGPVAVQFTWVDVSRHIEKYKYTEIIMKFDSKANLTGTLPCIDKIIFLFMNISIERRYKSVVNTHASFISIIYRLKANCFKRHLRLYGVIS